MTKKMEIMTPREFSYQGQKNIRRSRRRRKKRGPFVIIGILILCIAAATAFFLIYKDVHIRYCMELGDPMPPATVYAKGDNHSIEYLTETSVIDVTKTGHQWIHISVDGSDRLVILNIEDSVAPTAQPVELNISIKDEVTPDQLISDLTDAGPVKVNWDKAPQFGTAGDYSVVITMKDLSGNSASVTSLLHIRAVVDTLTYEAGAPLPALQDFLTDTSLDAALITDLNTLPLDKPGQYDVTIDVGSETYKTKLDVVDTAAPELAVKMVQLFPGGQASPEDFVASASDATALSYAFSSQPDYNQLGFQNVDVLVTDLGENMTTATATLLISNVAPVSVEIRDTPLTAEDFSGLESYNDIVMAQETVPDTLGDHDVELILDGETNMTRVTVIDTTPPAAEAKDVAWYLDHPITADNFVTNAFDYTNIIYAFKNEPDWTQQSAQDVTVILTDEAGNTSEYTASMTLDYDTEAPSLYGVKDRYCYVDQAVAYFAEVLAEDNCDSEIDVEVDKSNVNIHETGTYEVTYTVTDSSGNTTTKSCDFTFIEESITDAELDEVATQVLSDITTEDMSLGQKAYAIYKYVYNHIKYNGYANKADWKYEAYRGMTSGRGDCFTFYATTKCLLEKIGAQTMCVERHGGNRTTHHYWLLVNLGTGWYHIDTTNVGPQHYECFMRTDAEMHARGANFWSFDHSLYPPTPDEKYVLE